MLSRRTNSIRFALFALLSLTLLALAAAAGDRVRFTPKFPAGETLRYRIESHTTTTGKTTTPIANPEGGSQSSQTIHLLVRLDALGNSPSGLVRARAAYEKSEAESESDALDLQAAKFADQYNRLEGRSFEFTIGPDGKFAAISDPSAAPSEPSAAQPVFTWLQGATSGGALPQKGIAIGQKWKSERPVENALLSGLTWSAESSYLRDEPCGSPGGAKTSATPSSVNPSECAVILTRFEILRRGSTHSDATPDEYRRHGLRTSGTWTGSGESLDSISLANGLLVSSTQSSTQIMDYEVTSASAGTSIHHSGKVQTQSEVTLVPDQP
jgi:hypothetical protein